MATRLLVFEPRAGSGLDVGFAGHRGISWVWVVNDEASPGLVVVRPRVDACL